MESLDRFRKGEAAFLLATDVAARGLDIQGVQVRSYGGSCSCGDCGGSLELAGCQCHPLRPGHPWRAGAFMGGFDSCGSCADSLKVAGN